MSKEITYTDIENTQLKLKEQSRQMLADRKYDFFITLTFKRDTTEEAASADITRFIKLMNTACFGRRSKKSIVVAPVIERHWSDSAHVHILMQDPRKRTATRSTIDLKRTIRDSWNRASSRTADVVKSSGPDEGWFEEIYDQHQLSWYLAKQIRFDSKDSIDFNNYTSERRGQTANLA
jgi:hypothetical protein